MALELGMSVFSVDRTRVLLSRGYADELKYAVQIGAGEADPDRDRLFRTLVIRTIWVPEYKQKAEAMYNEGRVTLYPLTFITAITEGATVEHLKWMCAMGFYVFPEILAIVEDGAYPEDVKEFIRQIQSSGAGQRMR